MDAYPIGPEAVDQVEKLKRHITEKYGAVIGDAGDRWLVTSTRPQFSENDREEIRRLLYPRAVEFREGDPIRLL